MQPIGWQCHRGCAFHVLFLWCEQVRLRSTTSLWLLRLSTLRQLDAWRTGRCVGSFGALICARRTSTQHVAHVPLQFVAGGIEMGLREWRSFAHACGVDEAAIDIDMIFVVRERARALLWIL